MDDQPYRKKPDVQDNTQQQEVIRCIEMIESKLKSSGLWSDDIPAPKKLNSTVPFAHDTLQFQEWLQWVMIPKLRALIETGQSLPENSDVASYAEVYFETLDSSSLIEDIRALDRALGRILH